MTFCKPV